MDYATLANVAIEECSVPHMGDIVEIIYTIIVVISFSALGVFYLTKAGDIFASQSSRMIK